MTLTEIWNFWKQIIHIKWKIRAKIAENLIFACDLEHETGKFQNVNPTPFFAHFFRGIETLFVRPIYRDTQGAIKISRSMWPEKNFQTQKPLHKGCNAMASALMKGSVYNDTNSLIHSAFSITVFPIMFNPNLFYPFSGLLWSPPYHRRKYRACVLLLLHRQERS